MVMVDVDIGLTTSTLPHITHVTMVDFCIRLFLLVIFSEVFMEIKELIVVVVMENVDLGINIPAIFPFTFLDKVLMVMVEVDIGPRSSPLPTII